MVIGCCDSRVSPEVIFDAGPGELFVVRNVANLVPVFQPDGGAHGVSAALEYAVQVLRIKHIVVLGHAQCGGIRAFIDDIDPLSPGDFIGRWMAMFIKPGEKVGQREHETRQDFTTRIEKAAVFRSLENLMTFPFVRTPRRARRDGVARRLFRRRRGLAVRARSGGEGISQRQGSAERVGRAKRKRAHHQSAMQMVGTSLLRHSLFASLHAAFFFAVISLRLIRHSAIWIALSAAPLRRLSDTHHSDRPFSTVLSSRMRLI